MNPKEYYYNRFRPQFNEWVSKLSLQGFVLGIYRNIPIQFLRKENLSHIPPKDYMSFYHALAYTVLIDQVMYTYFRKDYPKFEKMTRYPKIEYGLSNTYARPWDISHGGGGITTFEQFAEFFVVDIKQFFTDYRFETATWNTVKKAMLSDGDVVGGSQGEIFRKALEKIK